MTIRRHVALRTSTLVVIFATLSMATAAIPAQAAWSGSNGKVVFARGQKIVSQTAGGNEATLATGYVTAPSYSPNGAKIVYLRGNPDFGTDLDVWIMDANGDHKRNLTKSLSRYTSPTFSPNGARVMFTEYDGNPSGIRRLHTIKTDGTGRQEFAPRVKGTMQDGVWSPNGNKVAYAGGPFDKPPTLRTISANGDPDTVRILSTTMTNASHPDWDPDNSRLVFTRGIVNANQRIVYKINYDKTGLKKLADYGADNGADMAVWSPDGTRIAFDRTNYLNGSQPSIWTMKPDGTGKTRIDTNGYDASWQPR